MSNTQIAALVQNVLMIGGSLAVSTGKISAPDAQSIVGGIATAIGFFWNHFSALNAPAAPAK